MNKAKVVTAAATVAASFGVVTQVHADDTDLATVSNNTEVAQNQATDNVTKADVDVTKANLDAANQAVSSQEQVVDDAASTVDSAQEAYNQAQQATSDAQNLADQATPENIANAKTDVNSAQNQVEQADNTEKVAESTAQQAQEAVNNQSEVVDSAQSDVNTAQSAVDAAQKDVNDKQAILDGTGQAEIIANRDKAQADVNSAQAQVSQKEADLTKAQEADANRQIAIDNAKTAVDKANQNVTSTKSDLDAKTATATQTQATEDAAQSAVDAAQKDVNDKQAILDGTGQKAILDEADAAKVDKANKETALTEAQKGLKEAQEADANRQATIDNAKAAVDTANQNVTSTKSDLDAKTATAQQTEQALKDAETAYKTAENDYKAINKITLTQAYVEALKKYNDYSLSSEERQQVLKTLVEESEALAKVNSYKSNPNDDNSTKYQINDLPEDVIKELSQFAADLVNQIRKAFGTPQVSVTSSSVKFADLVTDGYVSDGWNVTKAINEGQVGHDAKAVNNAARYFGLPTSPSDDEATGGQYYEDWASSAVYDGITFATLKQRVYEAVTDFMFNADEWRHARDIVGGGDVNSHVYFAIDFSKPSSENGAFAGVHFISVAEDQLTTKNNNFDTNAIANPKSAENVTATYNAAKDSYNQATVANTAAQSAKSTAQSAYDNAISQLSSASSVLTQAQSVAIQTPTAQANLASAQSTLTQAKENLVSAQKAVEDLNADIKDKKANLASAKQVLATRQAALATKQTVLKAEQNRLANLQNSLATAQDNVSRAQANVVAAKANLDKAKHYLTSLQTAPQLLADAKKQEETARTHLLDALDTLETELLKLKDLQVKQAAAQAVYDTTSKAYQTILDAQEKQRLQDEYNAIVAQGKTPVPIVDETGKIVGYQVENIQYSALATEVNNTKATALSVKTANDTLQKSSEISEATLPETGESSSALVILLGFLMTLWGLVGVRHNKVK
ncbi:SEC10/PgrA surface exclusion domain-containing protein [Streptococcus agalactiae]|uniref:SEC10/PgrA surface exclusion domain-containing protein n=1 Tax=Streptococcus agalactiae TaxID=1311 RepID=UPI00030CF097|nr:SEC10/PgrA surface exclusion domain-containing protein [Streptococcus agalactiae]